MSISGLRYLMSSSVPPLSCLVTYLHVWMCVWTFSTRVSHPITLIFIWALFSLVKYLIEVYHPSPSICSLLSHFPPYISPCLSCTVFNSFFPKRKKEAFPLLLPWLSMPPARLHRLFSLLRGACLALAQLQVPVTRIPLVTMFPGSLSIH